MLHNGQRVGLGREGKADEVPRCFPFQKKNRERERKDRNCIDKRENSTFKNLNVTFFYKNATESLSQFLVTIIQEYFRIAAWIFPSRTFKEILWCGFFIFEITQQDFR